MMAFLLLCSGDRRGSNYSRNDIWQERPPNRILFAEELCTITVQELSNFWKLGQSYFSGELFTKEVMGMLLSKLQSTAGYVA